LAQGYHQIGILKKMILKLFFGLLFGHYQFRVLNFGLTNIHTTFQGVMNRTFHKYLGMFVLVYLDDIFVFSKNGENHKLHMKKVFKFFKNANYM